MSLNDPKADKRALLESARLAKKDTLVPVKTEAKLEYIKPEDATNKLRVIFDNSGSMSDSLRVGDTYSNKIKEAKKGVVEFLRNCTPNKDAVAIHLLNILSSRLEEGKELPKALQLCTLETDLVYLASSIDIDSISPMGGTPLFETLLKALKIEPKATRLIAFSDGEPNWYDREEIYELAKASSIPIDTVFFGTVPSRGADTMQEIAERTGGLFLAFDPAKGVSFASAFKYLSPGKRLQLMNAEFKAKLERGEIK